MANPVWPASLPAPDYGWTEGTVENEFLRSQSDAGVAKQRPRYTAVAIPISATLTLTPAQVSTLKGFFLTDCKRTLPFDWTDMLNDGPTVTYRFTKRPSYSRVNFNQVSVQLSLERMPTGYDGTGSAPPPGIAVPPSNTVAPSATASGPLNVGVTLHSTSGTWSGTPTPSLTYQWQSWNGSAWELVVGATANSYVPSVAGTYRCVVTGTNIGGNLAAASNSLVISVGATLPQNTVLPVITGNSPAGNTMTASTGTWNGTPAPTYSYQWQIFINNVWANISGATSSTYVTTESGSIRVRVTATNTAGSVVATSTSKVITASLAAPTNTVLPVISGTLVAGYEIETTTGTWSANPVPTYSYQWQSFSGSWINVGGATLFNFTPPSGGTYRCNVTASNSQGSTLATTVPVDVAAAASTVPDAPTIGIATRGNGFATVAFTPPVDNGGSPITSYQVISSPGAFEVSGLSSPIVVPNLTNGTAYTFTVRATNVIGQSLASAASNQVTPATVPGAPTIGTAVEGVGQATVSFTAPGSNGGAAITSYTAVSSPGGHAVTGNNSPLNITGLTNGQVYSFTVFATNAVGNSASSAASNSVIPKTVPGAPSVVSVTPSPEQLEVTITPPVSNGGSAITGYTAIATPGGLTGTAVGNTIIIENLDNGTQYTVQVFATNALGNGPLSTPSDPATPTDIPGAPTIGVATATNQSVSVAFNPPSYTGGLPITEYTVTSTPGGIIATGVSSPIVVPGLTNGTAYTFKVKATNSLGTGPESLASNSAVPKAVPGAPTITSVVAGDAQVTVNFNAPASSGGSAITQYVATSTPDGIQFTGATSPIIVPGLTNGTDYTFTVYAENAAGAGPESADSGIATPSTIPNAPTIGVATVTGEQEITVSFTPTSDGGSDITGFEVTSSPGAIVVSGASSPLVFIGLTIGQEYTFTAKAINANGSSVASAASNAVTAASSPEAPGMGTATPGDEEAVLTWTAGSSNSSAILEYRIYSDGVFIKTAASSPNTITGLTNGLTYLFTVTAVNALGESEHSAVSNVTTPSGLPMAPAISGVTSGNGQVSVAFVPANPNGSEIIDYDVTSSPGGFTASGLSSPIIVTGLTNGTAYTFTMTATNANGNSPASTASESVTPATVPGAPTIGTATASDAQASVAFTAPASNGGSAITGYIATASPGGATASGPSSPLVVVGLQNGVAHTFTVKAINAVGSSAASAVSNSVTPAQSATVPGAPTIGTATAASSGTVSVTFTPPGNTGGSVITGYTVTSSPGGLTGTGTSSPISVAGLTNGTAYRFSVTATNTEGTGPSSALSNFATPIGVPEAPVSPSATAGNTQATVTFNPPISNGGSPITGYSVTSSPGGIVANGLASPIIVPGLANGTAYTFTVTATNAAGNSAASVATNSVTPIASGAAGPFDAYYDPGFTPVMTRNLLTTPTESQPPVSNGYANASYIDQRFGTRIYRTVDASTGEWSAVPGITNGRVRHFYSRHQAFNYNGSRYLLIGGTSRYYVFDSVTFARLVGGKTNMSPLPEGAVGSNTIFPQSGDDTYWHPSNEDIIRFIPRPSAATNGLSFYEYNVDTLVTTKTRDLASRMSGIGMPTAARLFVASEGRPSNDGRYWCLMVENSAGTHLGYICYDYNNDVIVGQLVTSAFSNWVSMSPSGEYCILGKSSTGVTSFNAAAAAATVTGVRAYNRTFTNFTQLATTVTHGDVATDVDGDDVWIGQATQYFDQLAWGYIYYRKCSGGPPIPLYFRNSEGTSSQLHFSGACIEKPGWAIFSTYHDENANETGWADHSVFAIKLAPTTEVRRIAHTRCGQGATSADSYLRQPQATISADGTKVLFTPGWRETQTGPLIGEPEAYMVGLPSWFFGGSSGGGGGGGGGGLFTNGSFSDGLTGWSQDVAGWSAGAGGVATFNTTGTATYLYQPVTLDPGYYYTIEYTISNNTVGEVHARLGGGTNVNGAAQGGNGTYAVQLAAVAGNNTAGIRAHSNFVGSIDNISIVKGLAVEEEMIVNGNMSSATGWTITGGGWDISGGVATKPANATAGSLRQNATLVVGGQYRFRFDIVSRVSGDMVVTLDGGTQVSSQGQPGGTFNSVGSKEFVLTAIAGNTSLNFRAFSSFEGVIDNCSVVRIA